MKYASASAALSCLAALWASPAQADDCTPSGDAGRTPLSVYPRSGVPAGSEDVPANVFFLGAGGASFETAWSDGAGRVMSLTRDDDLSAIFGGSQGEAFLGEAYRADPPLAEGEAYAPEGCELPECDGFTVGAPDTTPPDRAVVGGLRVRLVEGGRGGGFSCPDRDFLFMIVSGGDDRAEDSELILLAYIAPTEALVGEQTIPQLAFRFSPYARSVEDLREVAFDLGLSSTRQRDGAHFRKAAPYCFAVALMDRAGNVGERSEPRCISTVDFGAPYVEVVDAGCCAVPGGREPARPWLLFVSMGALACRRRVRGV